MPIESVSQELNTWYEKNCADGGRLSWKTLEKKTGVTVSSISKIARGEIQRPKFETAAALLEAVLPDKKAEIEDYISAEYGAETISFEPYAPMPRKKVSAKSSAVLRDFVAFRLFKLALSGRHAIKDLEKRIGTEVFQPRLKTLCDLGLVYVDKAGFLRRKPSSQSTRNTYTTDIADEFRHIIDLTADKKVLAYQGHSPIDHDINRLLQLHITVDPDKLTDLGNEVLQFLEKISDKYETKDPSDGVEVFLNVVTGRFDFE